jgi:hydrogenase-4 component B
LAYSTIGQVGYILLGIGACLTLLGPSSGGGLALATIAFYAALFHTLNHGTFKSLLFLDAGSVLYATHTQDLNRLGGLMRRMPVTALTTLIGSLAIAGVPLFNGFASKWSLYVATILGSAEARVLALCAVVAILTSAITLALFMKFFGVIFLSRTSALVAAEPDPMEVGWPMRLPQIVLAALCFLVGLVPSLAFWLIHTALLHSQQGLGTILAKLSGASLAGVTGLNALSGGAVFIPLALLGVFAGLFVLAYRLSRLGAAERRAAEPWLCGYMRESEQNRYVAHNLYREVTRHFRWLGAAPAAHAIRRERAASSAQPSRKE